MTLDFAARAAGSKHATGSAALIGPTPIRIETYRRACPSCHGDGCLRGYYVGEIEQTTVCPTCSGLKLVDVDKPVYPPIPLAGPCPDCAWRGEHVDRRHRVRDTYVCGVCDGSRRVPLKAAK